MNPNICSFCGRRTQDEEIFLRGKTGSVCPYCIRQIAIVAQKESLLYREGKSSQAREIDWDALKPKEIKAFLDQFVVGQEEAKQALAVAIYNHYKRLAYLDFQKAKEGTEEVEIKKTNILLVGETGSGKTFLLETIARKLQVPFCIADATSLTQAGYVGEDVVTILARLLQAADYDIALAQRGIVYIDEFDKIARREYGAHNTVDIGRGVQQALLKLIEGSIVNISPEGGSRRHPGQKMVPINTENILFICGGAFEGIESIIKNRLQITSIGFQKDKKTGTKPEDLIRFVNAQDMKKYGIIPELVGRLPVIVHLNSLTSDMLRRILTKPKNAIMKQYKKLFAIDGVELSFTEEAVDYLVSKVVKLKLGARSLRGILEKVLKNAMFNLPSEKDVHKLVVDKQYAMAQLEDMTFTTKQKQAKVLSRSISA